MPIAGRQLLHSALKNLGDVLAQYPPASSSSVGRVVEFAVATTKSAAEVSAKTKIPTVASKVKSELLEGRAVKISKASGTATGPTAPTVSVPAINLESSPRPSRHQGASQAENILRVDAGALTMFSTSSAS
jgi:hypothetical protein